MTNKILRVRFRADELSLIASERARLAELTGEDIASSEVIRAVLARLKKSPLRASELTGVRLERGLAGATASVQARVQKSGVRAAAKAKKALSRANSENIQQS